MPDLKKPAAALAATILAGGMVLYAAAADAHTPKWTATCDTLAVSLTDYRTGGTNHASVWVNGQSVKSADFGSSLAYTWTNPARTQPYTYRVKVTAWDDPTASKGWSVDSGTKSVAGCPPTPTPTPCPTTTVTVTATPTPAPTVTTTATATATVTLPPVVETVPPKPEDPEPKSRPRAGLMAKCASAWWILDNRRSEPGSEPVRFRVTRGTHSRIHAVPPGKRKVIIRRTGRGVPVSVRIVGSQVHLADRTGRNCGPDSQGS